MGPQGAVEIVYRRELQQAADPVARRAELVAEYTEKYANPYNAAERGYVDDVIDPAETRQKIVAGSAHAAHQARGAAPPQARQRAAVNRCLPEISPAPTDEEAVAIVAAVEALWPQARCSPPSENPLRTPHVAVQRPVVGEAAAAAPRPPVPLSDARHVHATRAVGTATSDYESRMPPPASAPARRRRAPPMPPGYMPYADARPVADYASFGARSGASSSTSSYGLML